MVFQKRALTFQQHTFTLDLIYNCLLEQSVCRIENLTTSDDNTVLPTHTVVITQTFTIQTARHCSK